MKRKVYFCLAGMFVLLLIASCKKESRGSLEPQANNDLSIVSSGTKTVMISDTVVTEINTEMNLSFKAPTGVVIVSCTWYITEPNGQQSTIGGKEIIYRFLSLGRGGQIKVVGIDANNQTHQAINPAWVVSDISQVDPVTFWISTLISPNVFGINCAVNKRTATWNGTYGYTGNVTTPSWNLTTIAPADTNFILQNNILVPLTTGNGTQVSLNPVITATSFPFLGQMALVKTNLNSVQIWANLTGSRWVNASNPTLIMFSMAADGTITPNATGSVNGPGDLGDNIVQVTMGTDSVTVYLNNDAPATNTPFYTRGNPDGTWNGPLSQGMVANYPNWGKLTLAYDSLPATGLLILRFGSNISIPTSLNSNINQSGYWDGFSQSIRMIITKVQMMDKSGQAVPTRQLRSIRPVITMR